MTIDDRTEIDVFLCRNSTEWPLTVYESEAHVRAWLSGQEGNGHVHRAKLVIGKELELVQPDPFFQPKVQS